MDIKIQPLFLACCSPVGPVASWAPSAPSQESRHQGVPKKHLHPSGKNTRNNNLSIVPLGKPHGPAAGMQAGPGSRPEQGQSLCSAIQSSWCYGGREARPSRLIQAFLTTSHMPFSVSTQWTLTHSQTISSQPTPRFPPLHPTSNTIFLCLPVFGFSVGRIPNLLTHPPHTADRGDTKAA